MPNSSKGLGRWAWLRRFRVWEANRKVFEQPENWIEPESRDNKQVLRTKETDDRPPTKP